ncbi:MAG: DUF6768 family protein [Planctomycetota bacterium]
MTSRTDARVDEALRHALSREDRELLDQLDPDAGLLALTAEAYKGKMRGWNLLATVYTFIFFGLQIWFLVELLTAETALGAVKWLAGFSFAFVAVGLLKLWFWLRVNTLELRRELKRLEVILAASRA